MFALCIFEKEAVTVRRVYLFYDRTEIAGESKLAKIKKKIVGKKKKYSFFLAKGT